MSIFVSGENLSISNISQLSLLPAESQVHKTAENNRRQIFSDAHEERIDFTELFSLFEEA